MRASHHDDHSADMLQETETASAVSIATAATGPSAKKREGRVKVMVTLRGYSGRRTWL